MHFMRFNQIQSHVLINKTENLVNVIRLISII